MKELNRSAEFRSIEYWVEVLQSHLEVNSRGLTTPVYPYLVTLIEHFTTLQGKPFTYEERYLIPSHILENFNIEATRTCRHLTHFLKLPDPYASPQSRGYTPHKIIRHYYKSWRAIRLATRALLQVTEVR